MKNIPTKSNYEATWYISDYSFRRKGSILLERGYQEFEPGPQSGSREIPCHLHTEHREQGKSPGEKRTSFNKALTPGVPIALPYIVIIWRPGVHTNEPMRAHFSLKKTHNAEIQITSALFMHSAVFVHNLDRACFTFLP